MGARGSTRFPQRCSRKNWPAYASFARFSRRSFRHRHHAHRLFRHRRAEEEISAEDRYRRIALLLLPLGAASGFGRAGRRARAPCFPPTARTGFSTARRCGSPTAALPTSTSSSPRSTAKNSPASSSSAARRDSRRRGRKEDGHPRQLHGAAVFRECAGPEGKSAARIGRGHIVAFNTLNVGRFCAGRRIAWAAPRTCCEASSKYSKERTAFGKSHLRIRPH